ncbi:uncharacterized protein MONOS_6197 [Monocercomonoides exilis]|uniref:uncharacterized protein n=1 Tax=Monocercomonoides exilis TaxID=2049356 RepID=UPI003559A75C|nr:hypothetical protein MONOS_6197 [Monocercomonoides exilis]|eukprot:MONOS_6197.1-p1 / transcript=MONOS_6197.1 / gene=MONOS_6197 / organism=Monocercomonoides_exilis_PA203 / gene_product=unspecified product / transcript_product=unspecified product / location=Mono_scaffold00192:25184-25543(-) / protein_length=87 / sequence_SO=supercontig / SO=protein_coding / is_pseudo=false
MASKKAGRDPQHAGRPGLFNKEEIEEIEDCAIAQISSTNILTVSDIIRFSENVMMKKKKECTPTPEVRKISKKWARRSSSPSSIYN